VIVLYTDFGWNGPYLGQVRAALVRDAPAIPVIDLMADVPAFNPKAAAYLLAALIPEFPAGTVFLCVIDPGVGTGARSPVILNVDARWFVGPDNGLFDLVVRRGRNIRKRLVTWRPQRLSRTFHGRDLFAPVAAALARGNMVASIAAQKAGCAQSEWPDDLGEIIYIDGFGNAMTGIRAATVDPRTTQLYCAETVIPHGSTFAEVAKGELLWYENSNGLVEIAVNQGSAAQQLRVAIGSAVSLRSGA
jgi:S-adenosyl-L-methionine hydrolase (adenosine-forming)